MTDGSPIQAGVVRSTLETRSLDPSAHDPFGTDIVRLAFGRDAEGRIRHVSHVARGAACGCVCPACGEALVSRQGAQKAWHFAHASGKACKDALSAAAAGLLTQHIDAGEAFSLPSVSFTWGKTEHELSPARTFRFDKARDVKDPDTGVHVVIATTDTPSGPRDITIQPRLSRKTPLSITGTPGVSAIEIDLGDILKAFASANEDLGEEQLTHAMAQGAPRRWIHNQAAEQAYEAQVRGRIGAQVARAKDMRREGGTTETAVELQVREFGFGPALETDPLEGERFLGPTTSGWRAAFLFELVIRPVLERPEPLLVKDMSIDRRGVLRALTRSRIVRDPEVMRPRPTDDQAEFLARVPDFKPPIEVLKSYLEQLWKIGILAARPLPRRRADPRGPLDDRLLSVPGADWIITEDSIARIQARRARARRKT